MDHIWQRAVYARLMVEVEFVPPDEATQQAVVSQLRRLDMGRLGYNWLIQLMRVLGLALLY